MGEDGRLLFSSSYKRSKETIVYVDRMSETPSKAKRIAPSLMGTTFPFKGLLTYINN